MKYGMKVSVLGCGNVGVAIAADLSLGSHDVTLVKTSTTKSDVFEKLERMGNRVVLLENGHHKESTIGRVTRDFDSVVTADVIFVTVQSTYHEQLIKKIGSLLNPSQIVICICSYMSSFYFCRYCNQLPTIVETTGPYLEGRVMNIEGDDDLVFRVGCRLERSPLSIFNQNVDKNKVMDTIRTLHKGYCNEYSVLECALQNPNMILHTVGAIMSIPRIEYSKGNFCMYREAYARGNDATLKIMLRLDEEKKNVLNALGCKQVDIFKAGGFLGDDPLESFYRYSESEDRAISPTSVRSRYITEDVSQGLVLMESIADRLGLDVPLASSLITISSVALSEDFRGNGRTVQRLGAGYYIDTRRTANYGYFRH